MVGMRNNLGARTRVRYGTSTAHYLRDTYRRPMRHEAYDQLGAFVGYAGAWKTTLPFPVQVVDRVEVIDEISKGKLTTRYFYHHGYWDGGEREFRGFGRVDQFDTETFEAYNTDSLILEADPLGSPVPLGVSAEHYAPPVLAKNWFHLGPVGAEKGDWKEVDFADEYWSGDTNMLRTRSRHAADDRRAAPPCAARCLPHPARHRPAQRAVRHGWQPPGQLRPYTVSETQTGLRLVDSPNTNPTIKALAVQTHSNHIFFSFGLSSRSTTWERGTDPMTKFSFTGGIDAYGQPLSQISIAVPRGKDPRTGGELQGHTGVYDPARGYDATIQYTKYIYVDPRIDPISAVEGAIAPTFPGQYVVDRAKQARSYEARNNGSMSVFALRDIMLCGAPIHGGSADSEHKAHCSPSATRTTTVPTRMGLPTVPWALMGYPCAPKRSWCSQPSWMRCTARRQPPALVSWNTGTAPDWSAFPPDPCRACSIRNAGTPTKLQVVVREDYVAGYYTSAQRTRFDFHDSPDAKGLPVAMRDVFDHEASIEYDDYQLLPVKVTDPVGMETSFGVRLPRAATQAGHGPEQNSSAFAFTPLGLMHKTALLGKDQGSEGDTLDDPGVLLEYDLFAFKNSGSPVWVKTTQRVHHINADYLSTLPGGRSRTPPSSRWNTAMVSEGSCRRARRRRT
jgi:hypothetical protein